MTKNDFVKEPASFGELDSWHSKSKIPTLLGDFKVVLLMGEDDHDAPDEVMIEHVNKLIEFLQRNFELVQRIVFGAYLHAARTDPGDLKIYKVPLNLSMDALGPYLFGRNVSVSRYVDNGITVYETGILIIPPWDEEHALNMSVVDGQITRINDYEYRLVGEELFLE